MNYFIEFSGKIHSYPLGCKFVSLEKKVLNSELLLLLLKLHQQDEASANRSKAPILNPFSPRKIIYTHYLIEDIILEV